MYIPVKAMLQILEEQVLIERIPCARVHTEFFAGGGDIYVRIG